VSNPEEGAVCNLRTSAFSPYPLQAIQTIQTQKSQSSYVKPQSFFSPSLFSPFSPYHYSVSGSPSQFLSPLSSPPSPYFFSYQVVNLPSITRPTQVIQSGEIQPEATAARRVQPTQNIEIPVRDGKCKRPNIPILKLDNINN
jgi:hypothetical protein